MTDLLSESRNLSELLLSSSESAREMYVEIASRLELPVALARALCLLEKPETMTGLALKHRCDKSYITSLTDQMEALGYVKRVPGEDRRTKMIELTNKGLKTRTKLEHEIAQLSPMMNRLTKLERQTLRELLEKVAVDQK